MRSLPALNEAFILWIFFGYYLRNLRKNIFLAKIVVVLKSDLAIKTVGSVF